jgi:hypothetical protein
MGVDARIDLVVAAKMVGRRTLAPEGDRLAIEGKKLDAD